MTNILRQIYDGRYITADILRQIYYGRYITADILRQIYYGRYITANILRPIYHGMILVRKIPGIPGTSLAPPWDLWGPLGTPLGPPRDASRTTWGPPGTQKRSYLKKHYSARSSQLLRSNLLIETHRVKASPGPFIHKKAAKRK